MTDHRSSRSGSASPWDRERIFQLLVEAGKVALSHRQHLVLELKADHSIVTQADREVEALFAREFDHPERATYLIGEETIEEKGEDYIEKALQETTYIIDPIDGTAPYSHGLTHWGISIGRAEAGRLTDGAVYLPEVREGEMVLSDGAAVLEGLCGDRRWSWRRLKPAPTSGASLVAISQDMAKTARMELENPVQALCTAVVPLVGMLQGRFLAYAGTLKLWDLAGCLPLLFRHGLSLSHFLGDPPAPMGLEVTPEHYDLEPASPTRWTVRDGLLVCAPGEDMALRRVLT